MFSPGMEFTEVHSRYFCLLLFTGVDFYSPVDFTKLTDGVRPQQILYF
jgi:hypothetical protein